MDGAICRAARGFLNWTSRRLSVESGVSVSRIFEVERDRPIEAHLVRSLEAAFARFGVVAMRTDGGVVGLVLSPSTEPTPDIPSSDLVVAELDRVAAMSSSAVRNEF